MSASAKFSGTLTLSGPVDHVFGLFSPAGERDWVPGWNPELIYPAGVEWAAGQIFTTREETGEAIWIVTRLDRAGHAAEYHRVEPGRYVARVRVHCAPAGPDRTHASVEYEFIGLSDRGNADIAAMTPSAYAEKMARWTKWIESR